VKKVNIVNLFCLKACCCALELSACCGSASISNKEPHSYSLAPSPSPVGWGGESKGKKGKNSWVGMRTVSQNGKGRRKQQSIILIKAYTTCSVLTTRCSACSRVAKAPPSASCPLKY